MIKLSEFIKQLESTPLTEDSSCSQCGSPESSAGPLNVDGMCQKCHRKNTGVTPNADSEESGASEEAKKLKLVHQGWGRYGKDKNSPATHISKGGKLVPLAANEPNGTAEPSRKDEPSPARKAADDYIRSRVADMNPGDRFKRQQTLAKRGQGEFPGEVPDMGKLNPYGVQLDKYEEDAQKLIDGAGGNVEKALQIARQRQQYWDQDYIKRISGSSKGRAPHQEKASAHFRDHFAQVANVLQNKIKSAETGIPSLSSMVPQEKILSTAETLAQIYLDKFPTAREAHAKLSEMAQEVLDEMKSVLKVGGLQPEDEEGWKARLKMYQEALDRVEGFAREEEEGDTSDPERGQRLFGPDQ